VETVIACMRELGEIREIDENLDEDNGNWASVSNQAPPEYRHEALPVIYFQKLTKFGCNGNVRWIARPWLLLRPCQWRPDVRVTAPRG
jgi:hypothetical protein